MRRHFMLQTLSDYSMLRTLLIQEVRRCSDTVKREGTHIIRNLPRATAISDILRDLGSNKGGRSSGGIAEDI